MKQYTLMRLYRYRLPAWEIHDAQRPTGADPVVSVIADEAMGKSICAMLNGEMASYPTEDAYKAACAANEHNRGQAEAWMAHHEAAVRNNAALSGDLKLARKTIELMHAELLAVYKDRDSLTAAAPTPIRDALVAQIMKEVAATMAANTAMWQAMFRIHAKDESLPVSVRLMLASMGNQP